MKPLPAKGRFQAYSWKGNRWLCWQVDQLFQPLIQMVIIFSLMACQDLIFGFVYLP